MADALEVTSNLTIPRSELVHRASRSGGAGGQHVNTSSTRIELLWPFENSPALTDAQRARLRSKLASRIDSDGMIRVVAANRRSQLQNRVAAEERLAIIVRDALREPKARRATRPTKASKERRLTNKKRRGETKTGRQQRDFD